MLYVVAGTDEGGTITTPACAERDQRQRYQRKPGHHLSLGVSSKQQSQRPALILANGYVYVSFGSEGDTTPWHGWILAFAADTLKQVAVLELFAERKRGRKSPAVAAGQRLTPAATSTPLQATATCNGTTEYSMKLGEAQSDAAGAGFLDSVQRVQSVERRWRPGLRSFLAGAKSIWQRPSDELIGCGKPTPVYVVDRDNMGGFHSGSDSQIVQSLPSVVGGGTSSQRQYKDHCFMTPRTSMGTSISSATTMSSRHSP